MRAAAVEAMRMVLMSFMIDTCMVIKSEQCTGGNRLISMRMRMAMQKEMESRELATIGSHTTMDAVRRAVCGE